MNLRDFIKRNKVLINIVIGLLGVVFVLVACFVLKNQNIREIVSDIGVSFVSTAIIAIILICSLPEESGDATELFENGLKKIYKDGKVGRFSEINLPGEHLDIIGFSIQEEWTKDDFKDAMADRIKSGLKVRILALHPDSVFVPSKVQKGIDQNDDNFISTNINVMKSWFDDICTRMDASCKGSIEIQFYDNLPLFTYCRADNMIWCGSDQLRVHYEGKLVYEYQVRSVYGKEYTKLFENCWKGNDGLNIVEYDKIRFHGDQRKSIEAVLKYFCDNIGKNCENPVKGVVVLFKDAKRKTIFSCNKGSEKYKCHRKSSGVVGELVESQADQQYNQARITLFSDFSKQLSAIHCKGERLQRFPRKKKYSNQSNNGDPTTNAVLATGLYVNGVLIGAVTFDFFDFPAKYQHEAKELKNSKDGTELKKDILLKSWFEMAFTCSEIISNMVGHYVSSDFQILFDSTWEEC